MVNEGLRICFYYPFFKKLIMYIWLLCGAMGPPETREDSRLGSVAEDPAEDNR